MIQQINIKLVLNYIYISISKMYKYIPYIIIPFLITSSICISAFTFNFKKEEFCKNFRLWQCILE